MKSTLLDRLLLFPLLLFLVGPVSGETIFSDGFESGDTSAWTSLVPVAPSPDGGKARKSVSASVTAQAARTGNFGFQIEADGFNEAVNQLVSDALSGSMFADTLIRVSFWVASPNTTTLPLGRAPTVSDPQRTQVSLRYGSDLPVPLLPDTVLNLTAGQFQEVEVSFTPSAADLAKGTTSLRFDFDGNGEDGQTFYFDDFLIESVEAAVVSPADDHSVLKAALLSKIQKLKKKAKKLKKKGKKPKAKKLIKKARKLEAQLAALG